MDNIVQYICEHAYLAPYIFFFLLLLAGFNIPVSEDIILITGGMICATCAPKGYFFFIYIALYLGCIISAWEAYWLGRLLGPKLYRIKWISSIIHPGRVEKLNHFYEKYGIFTFFVVRFIPGGPRNAFFMTAGLGRMPFNKFIIRDMCAALISTTTIFSLGYIFAYNYDKIVYYFKKYNFIVISLILGACLIVGGIIYFRKKRKIDTM